MDPLSVAASIIAVISAANTLVSGINKAREFRHCPNTLRELRNRLITHAAFLELSKPTFDFLEKSLEPDTAQALVVQLSCSARQVDHLRELIDRVVCNVQGSALSNAKISLRAWMRYRKEIDGLQKALTEDRQALSDLLVAYNSQWTLSISDIAVLVDSDALTQIHEEPANSASPLVELNAETLQTDSKISNVFTATSTNQKIMPQNSPLGRGEVNIAVTVRRNACSIRCPCRCHKQTRLDSPTPLRAAIGYLLYSYTGQASLQQGQDCGCFSHYTANHRLLYVFPSWVFRYALSITCTFGSLTGPGVSWSVKLPRLLPSGHAVWSAIEENNVSVFRTMLTTRSISFHDIDGANHESFLDYAVRTQASDISELLLLQGVDTDDLSSNPVSVISRLAINKLCGGPDSERCGYSTLSSDSPQDILGLKTLHRAALGLTSVALQSLLEDSTQDINEQDFVGNTALMWAISTRNGPFVDLLLNYGANPRLSRIDGQTALHEAAEWGNYDVIRNLILHGVAINSINMNGRTALHLASERCGQLDAIQLLLDKCADINTLDAWGKTSLHRCCTFGDLASAKCLLQYGAMLDMKTSETSDDGRTPLILAVQHDKTEIVQLLIGQGARTDRLSSNHRSVLHFAALYANAHTICALRVANFGHLPPTQRDEWGYSAFEVLYRRKNGQYPDLRPFTDEVEVSCLQLLLKACFDREKAVGLDIEEQNLLETCTKALELYLS